MSDDDDWKPVAELETDDLEWALRIWLLARGEIREGQQIRFRWSHAYVSVDVETPG